MPFSFFVVAVGVFMSTLDSSMLNLALPAIMADFQSTLRATEWVVLIYLLTVTATLLFWGHFSDRWGRRRIYALGLLGFGLGSLACACAPGLGWLIASRWGQALGAAMMMATGPAIVKEIFPPSQLGRGLGLIGVAVSLGLMTGPGVAGLLLEKYTWRAIFLITVPAGILFAYLAMRLLPSGGRTHKRGFDLPGALLWLVSISLVAIGLNGASAPEGPRPGDIAALAAGALLTLLLVQLERKTTHPLLPLALFRRRFFVTGMTSATLSFVCLFAVLLLIPFFLTRILGLSGTPIGLVMMAIPGAVLIVAPVAGRLADRIGSRLLTTGGLLLSGVGIMLLAGLPASARPSEVAVRLALLGCGQAMFLSPNSASVLGRVEKEYVGTAAALLASARNLGMLLGIAMAGLLFSISFGHHTGGLDLRDFSAEHAPAFMLALKNSLLITAGIAWAGAAVSWRRESRGTFHSPPKS